jgi:uncharacterized protein YcbK (DUF882 family)
VYGGSAGKQARLTLLEAWFFRLRFRALPALALATAICALLTTISAAPALAETRTLKLYNTHTHERVSITFKRNGRYVSEGLRDLNRFLRDWRRNEMTKMDPELFDLVWEVYQAAGTNEAIHVVSGYRSPATNNMLRSRSRGVAKSSQHTRGRAMDFYIPGVNIAKLRALGLRKEVGGVGFYPSSRSPFVHMDTGTVRHWPRMTRSQLAKVFPRGDTIHIPTDGKKMPGYAQALARHKSGASRRPTAVASAASSRPLRPAGELAEGSIRAPLPGSASGGPGLLARIFGGDEDEGEDTGANPTPPAPVRTARTQVASAAPQAAPPVPSEAPPGVRSAEPAPAPAAAPAAADPVVVAQVLPRTKPAGFSAVVAAATAGTVAPGTLEAQAQRLASGLPPVDRPSASPESQPTLVVASAPPAKPAELRQGPLGGAALAAVPRPAPADGVSAIAAATGATQPSSKPQPNLAATLAYAPAAATAPATGPVGIPQRRAAAPAEAGKTARASVSGRVPEPVIRDPLARFAALPDRTALPDLISGRTTTRTQTFARLQHPNQRRLELLLAPGGRVFANRFGTAGSAAAAPRADRFEGPAVVLLPVFSLQ